MTSTPHIPRPPHRPGTLRAGLPALVCLLFFVTGLAQTAIVPLLPRIAAVLHTHGSFSATVLALPGLAMLVVSVPAGLLADRYGARRVSLGAVALLVLGCAGGAIASPGLLIAARLVYGVAYGMLWTAGAAWLAELSPSGSAGAAVGRAVVCSSVGTMVGPALGGMLGGGGGVGGEPGGLAFLLIALAAALLGAVLIAVSHESAGARARTPARPARPSFPTRLAAREALRVTFISTRALLGDRVVLAGAGSLAVSGALAGVTQLLIPEGLQVDGLQANAIGLIFSAAAVGYIATSTAFVRLGKRGQSPGVNAIVTALAAVALVPALASGRSVVLIAALMFTAAPRGAINVVAYGVASTSQRRSGSVYGVLGMAWAAAMVVTPLLAAALQGAVGDRAAYLAAIVPCAMIAISLLALALAHGGHRRRATAQLGAGDDLQAAQP